MPKTIWPIYRCKMCSEELTSTKIEPQNGEKFAQFDKNIHFCGEGKTGVVEPIGTVEMSENEARAYFDTRSMLNKPPHLC